MTKFKRTNFFWPVIRPVIIFSAILIILSSCIAIFFSAKAQAELENYGEHVPGEVIACVETDPYFGETDTSNLTLKKVNDQMNSFLAKYDCETLLCVAGNDTIYNQLQTNSNMVTVKDVSGSNASPAQTRYIKIKFDENQKSMSQVISEIKSQPCVKNVEPNYIMQATSNATSDYTVAQYAYDKEGATGTTHNKVGMNVANWNTSTPNVNPNDKVVVAVIDSGVDYNHPDLLCAGDASQYGDLRAITGIGGPQGYNAGADPASEEAKDPMDDIEKTHGHGTHVAGIIGATWNNYGVSGGASVCSVLPVKTANQLSGGFLNDAVVRAYGYVIKAKQSGLNIKAANNSWGGSGSCSYLADVVNLAGQNNIISVFGSGNDSNNIDNYPYTGSSLQNNPYVLTVDSSNCNGNFSVFSNYGVKTTDVCAPGDGIYSTVPSSVDGGNYNFMSADTRFMSTDEYVVKDDFEATSPKLNYKYYSDIQCTKELTTTIGSSSEQKGYKSNKALLLPEDSEIGLANCQWLVIEGDYAELANYKRISVLVNADSKGRKTDVLQATAVDANNLTREYEAAQFSPAANVLPYGSVSIQTSQLTEKDGKFRLGLAFIYRDENNQILPCERYVDNVCFTKSEYPYRILSGTSMASPACCGVTAVLATSLSDEPAEKIVARIKGGTNHKSDLIDKCYSGGIVDLGRASSKNADTELDPVVVSAKLESSNDTNSVVKLEGYFLGDLNSIVNVNGIGATSVIPGKSGDRQTLTCVFPTKIAGYASITVNKTNKALTKYFDLGNNDEQLLERISLPDKNSEEFKDFYNAMGAKLVYASDKYLCTEGMTIVNFFSYIYNTETQLWSKLDYNQTILPALKQKINDIDSTSLICCFDDVMIFDGEQTGQGSKGLAFYNLSNGEISVNKLESENIILTNGFVDNEKLYFIGNSDKVTSLYYYNADEKKLDLVQADINCGEFTEISKLDDNNFLVIDKGYLFPVPAQVKNDMYLLTLDNETDGAKCEKMDQVAYPSLVTDATQDKCVGQAVVDGMLMMSGPAIFDKTFGGVAADTFLRNIDTKEEMIVPGLLSNNRAWQPSSAKGGGYVYTYFTDADGPVIAKRYVGSPVPPIPDPTPTPQGESLEPIATAATGDDMLTVMLAIVALVIAGGYAIRSCKILRRASLTVKPRG